MDDYRMSCQDWESMGLEWNREHQVECKCWVFVWKSCGAIARNAICLVSREILFGDHQLSSMQKLNVSLCFLLDVGALVVAYPASHSAFPFPTEVPSVLTYPQASTHPSDSGNLIPLQLPGWAWPSKGHPVPATRGQQTFPGKGQMISSLGSVVLQSLSQLLVQL